MLTLPQLSRSADPYTVGVKQVLYDVSKPRKRRLGQFKKCILFVLEICSGGELFSYLETCGRFEEVLARTYFRQIMEALSFVGTYERRRRSSPATTRPHTWPLLRRRTPRASRTETSRHGREGGQTGVSQGRYARLLCPLIVNRAAA